MRWIEGGAVVGIGRTNGECRVPFPDRLPLMRVITALDIEINTYAELGKAARASRRMRTVSTAVQVSDAYQPRPRIRPLSCGNGA